MLRNDTLHNDLPRVNYYVLNNSIKIYKAMPSSNIRRLTKTTIVVGNLNVCFSIFIRERRQK